MYNFILQWFKKCLVYRFESDINFLTFIIENGFIIKSFIFRVSQPKADTLIVMSGSLSVRRTFFVRNPHFLSPSCPEWANLSLRTPLILRNPTWPTGPHLTRGSQPILRSPLVSRDPNRTLLIPWDPSYPSESPYLTRPNLFLGNPYPSLPPLSYGTPNYPWDLLHSTRPYVTHGSRAIHRKPTKIPREPLYPIGTNLNRGTLTIPQGPIYHGIPNYYRNGLYPTGHNLSQETPLFHKTLPRILLIPQGTS